MRQKDILSPLHAHASGFAYGKIILLGEHAVVYGYPALAGAIHKGCRVDVAYNQEACSQFFINHQSIDQFTQYPQLRQAFEKALDLFELSKKSLTILAHFDIPIGAGLGSSAALSVALCRALAHFSGKPQNDKILFDFALQLECLFHGRSSGLDISCAQTGQLGLFDVIHKFSPFSLSSPLPFLIVDTGVERTTRHQVEFLASQRQQKREFVDTLLAEIGSLVLKGYDYLMSNQISDFSHLMNRNQTILSQLQLTCPTIDKTVETALQHGALAAKMTGAGGGGCVIVLCPNREQYLSHVLKPYCRQIFYTQVGLPITDHSHFTLSSYAH